MSYAFLAVPRWVVPTATIVSDGDRRVVEGRYAGDAEERESADGALEQLCKIASAREAYVEEAIIDFVERHGQLLLGPAWEPGAPVSYPDEHFEGTNLRHGVGIHREDVDAYRFYAALAVAVMRTVRQLRRAQPVTPADLSVFAQFFAWTGDQFMADIVGRAAPGAIAADAEWPRLLVADTVNWCLDSARARPGLEWNGERPGRLWSGGLWGALAVQLLDAVIADARPACSGCGKNFLTAHDRRASRDHPLFRERRPALGSRGFCAKCQHEGARLRKDRYNRKSRERPAP